MRVVLRQRANKKNFVRKPYDVRDYKDPQDFAEFFLALGNLELYEFLTKNPIPKQDDFLAIFELLDKVLKRYIKHAKHSKQNSSSSFVSSLDGEYNPLKLYDEIHFDSEYEDSLERFGLSLDPTGAVSSLLGAGYDLYKKGDFNLDANLQENLGKSTFNFFASQLKSTLALGGLANVGAGIIISALSDELYEVTHKLDRHFGFGGEATGKYKGALRYGESVSVGEFVSDVIKEIFSFGEADTKSFNQEIGIQRDYEGNIVGFGRRPSSVEDVLAHKKDYDPFTNSIFFEGDSLLSSDDGFDATYGFESFDDVYGFEMEKGLADMLLKDDLTDILKGSYKPERKKYDRQSDTSSGVGWHESGKYKWYGDGSYFGDTKRPDESWVDFTRRKDKWNEEHSKDNSNGGDGDNDDDNYDDNGDYIGPGSGYHPDDDDE